MGDREEVPDTELVAAEATWLEPMGEGPCECLLQCRAQRGPAPAVVTPPGKGRFSVRFTGGPDRWPGPLSPGQPAVCFADDRLLAARGKSPPDVFPRMKTSGFHGCYAPAIASLRSSRLFVHSLLVS